MEMRNILLLNKKDKRGVAGLTLAKEFVLILLTIVILAVVAIVVVAALKNSNILPAGSVEYNQTQALSSNFSAGVAGFFSNIPVWFQILSVVIIILLISVVILVITGWQGGGGKNAGSL